MSRTLPALYEISVYAQRLVGTLFEPCSSASRRRAKNIGALALQGAHSPQGAPCDCDHRFFFAGLEDQARVTILQKKSKLA
jgi:hypothetical protein